MNEELSLISESSPGLAPTHLSPIKAHMGLRSPVGRREDSPMKSILKTSGSCEKKKDFKRLKTFIVVSARDRRQSKGKWVRKIEI